MIDPVDSAIQLLRTTKARLKQAMNSKRLELDQTRTPARHFGGKLRGVQSNYNHLPSLPPRRNSTGTSQYVRHFNLMYMTERGKIILDFDTEIITVHYEIEQKKT